MAISGTIITKFKTQQTIRASKNALGKAYKEVAAAIEAEVKTKCRAKQSPPSSRPGQYPSEDTGNFATGINVTGTANGITIASNHLYGAYLEHGVGPHATKKGGIHPGMAARPWASKILKLKKWEGQIAKLAMEYTGGKAKTSKKGRR